MKNNRLWQLGLAFVFVWLALTDAARAQTNAPEFATLAPGLEHLLLKRGAEPELWQINLLRVDLARYEMRLAHALDEGVGVEPTSSLASRYGAAAALNGGYFELNGPYRGDCAGLFVLDGKLISEPIYERAAIGLNENGGLLFGRVLFAGTVRAGHAEYKLSGVNRARKKDEMLIFTPEFHATTLTGPDGVEIIVRRGRVAARREGAGSSRVPSDGFVVSANGAAREWALKNLPVGAKVSWKWQLQANEDAGKWRRARNIVGGGPLLIKDGRVVINVEAEHWKPDFAVARHPRTALARLRDGRLLLAAVDGRQPKLSVGMSLKELADLLLEFGATDALNLDGGGSTTMVLQGKVVNSPSDATGERPVSDALLFFPRVKAESGNFTQRRKDAKKP